MRTMSASQLKRGACVLQKCPHDGTRLRRIYDRLMESKGVPLVLDGNEYESHQIMHNCLVQLKDFYGLDVRHLHHNGRKGFRGGNCHGPSTYILAGEWFGSEYRDYIAKSNAKMDAVVAEMVV